MIAGQLGITIGDANTIKVVKIEGATMSGELFEREFRNLQELVEEGLLAIMNIGLSEARLMSKPVREALVTFEEKAVVVVAELVAVRNREAQSGALESDIKGLIENAGMTFDQDDAAALKDIQRLAAGADEGEPEAAGNDRDEQMVVDAANVQADKLGMDKMSKAEEQSLRDQYRAAQGQGHGEPEELGETVMCPQTKRGVSCTRTLHNVGLHIPDGYPGNASWTDKESD